MAHYIEYPEYTKSKESHPVNFCFIPRDRVEISDETFSAVLEWIVPTCGDPLLIIPYTSDCAIRDARWGFWDSGKAVFFQREADAFLFKMRWC